MAFSGHPWSREIIGLHPTTGALDKKTKIYSSALTMGAADLATV